MSRKNCEKKNNLQSSNIYHKNNCFRFLFPPFFYQLPPQCVCSSVIFSIYTYGQRETCCADQSSRKNLRLWLRGVWPACSGGSCAARRPPPPPEWPAWGTDRGSSIAEALQFYFSFCQIWFSLPWEWARAWRRWWTKQNKDRIRLLLFTDVKHNN